MNVCRHVLTECCLCPLSNPFNAFCVLQCFHRPSSASSSAPSFLVEVRSDNVHCVKEIWDDLPRWWTQGWKASQGREVSNRDPWELLDEHLDVDTGDFAVCACLGTYCGDSACQGVVSRLCG